jgi:hypothetical protein
MSFHYSSLSAGLPFRPFRRRLEQLQLRSFPSLRPPRAAQHWAQHWAAPRGYLDRLQLRRHRWCVRRLGPPPRWGRWAMESPRGRGRPAAAEDTWPKERMVGTPWHPQRNKVMMLEIHSQNSQKFRCRDCWVNVLSYLATCNIMQLSMPHPHIAIIAETLVINGIVSQELQSSPRRRVTNPDACADPQVWSSSRWLKQNINNVSQITTPTIASGMHNQAQSCSYCWSYGRTNARMKQSFCNYKRNQTADFALPAWITTELHMWHVSFKKKTMWRLNHQVSLWLAADSSALAHPPVFPQMVWVPPVVVLPWAPAVGYPGPGRGAGENLWRPRCNWLDPWCHGVVLGCHMG